MAFPDLFKLEKMRIEAYADRDRSRKTGEFVAMFNPATLSQSFAIDYAGSCEAGGVTQAARFVRKAPADLSVTLLLDGTGVDAMGLAGRPRSVGERIADILSLAYRINGDTHEPSFLWVKWGDWGTELGRTGYKCRLKTVGITYQSFNRDGSPLRAELALALIADDDPGKQRRAAGLSSPDVPHSRVVRAADTLPAMTRAVYGTPRAVAAVARANDLDQLRSLPTGRELVFPPIAS